MKNIFAKALEQISSKEIKLANKSQEKKVRFGTVKIRKISLNGSLVLWHDMKSLDTEVLDDVDHMVQSGKGDTRGLEFCLPQSQKRHRNSLKYVRAVVEKGHQLQDLAAKPKSTRRRGRNADAEQLAAFATANSLMSRRLALGVAAQDALEAEAIYNEAGNSSTSLLYELLTSRKHLTSTRHFSSFCSPVLET